MFLFLCALATQSEAAAQAVVRLFVLHAPLVFLERLKAVDAVWDAALIEHSLVLLRAQPAHLPLFTAELLHACSVFEPGKVMAALEFCDRWFGLLLEQNQSLPASFDVKLLWCAQSRL